MGLPVWGLLLGLALRGFPWLPPGWPLRATRTSCGAVAFGFDVLMVLPVVAAQIRPAQARAIVICFRNIFFSLMGFGGRGNLPLYVVATYLRLCKKGSGDQSVFDGFV